MRVTNNMIMDNASSNINSTKELVNKRNTQMTSQKKISKPSEDPVIAVRSLRLSTTLSQVQQYYEKNIPDATSWLDVTETALLNMRDIVADCRELAVTGSTDTYNEEDRSTLMTQLEALQKQLFLEGNSNYAGRTVFTGYRTDKSLTFTEGEANTSYEISQKIDITTSIEESRYYSGQVTIPTNATELRDDDNTPTDVEESIYYRVRLAYGDVNIMGSYSKYLKDAEDALDQAAIADANTQIQAAIAGGTVYADDEARALAFLGFYNAYKTANPIDTAAVKAQSDAQLEEMKKMFPELLNDAKDITSLIGTEGLSFTKLDANGKTVPATNSIASVGKIRYYNDEDDWNKDTSGGKEKGKVVGDNEVVIIEKTGEVIFGKTVAATLLEEKASLNISYEKTGFTEGQLRPEYYYNCIMTKDKANNTTSQEYTKFDDAGKQIDFDINFTVAAGQDITVNTEASDVFDSSLQRDIDEMISAVSASIAAHQKVDKLTLMKDETQYESDSDQKRIQEWLDAAKREADYADDNMQKLFSTELGKIDTYYAKISLEVTNIGCKTDSLKLTKTRVGDQQETVQELQSSNDDIDLSQIIIDYTAAYTAYQASLQAAGKLSESTLLNYI